MKIRALSEKDFSLVSEQDDETPTEDDDEMPPVVTNFEEKTDQHTNAVSISIDSNPKPNGFDISF